jgi:hypothetical protein
VAGRKNKPEKIETKTEYKMKPKVFNITQPNALQIKKQGGSLGYWR